MPLFISPLKADAKGKIESITMKNGKVNVVVKNDGNLHFILKSIIIKGKNLKGEEIFKKELGGWYLLSGISRLYTTPIPQEVCKKTVRLDIEVKTDRFNVDGKVDVDKTMCSP